VRLRSEIVSGTSSLRCVRKESRILVSTLLSLNYHKAHPSSPGQTPCLFSEIGIPYDMDKKAAYSSGDYSSQIRAMDANHFALEGANVGFTLWTYCATVS